MKKSIQLVILLSFCSLPLFLNAQNYETALGVRAGAFNGITAKHFVNGSHAVEGILSLRWGGFNITGLYEVHDDAFDAPGLQWYYGFGAHLGFWNSPRAWWADENNNYVVVGVDGIIGLEYTFSEIPVNISLDWKPALNLIGYSGFWGDGGGLSIRYVF